MSEVGLGPSHDLEPHTEVNKTYEWCPYSGAQDSQGLTPALKCPWPGGHNCTFSPELEVVREETINNRTLQSTLHFWKLGEWIKYRQMMTWNKYRSYNFDMPFCVCCYIITYILYICKYRNRKKSCRPIWQIFHKYLFLGDRSLNGSIFVFLSMLWPVPMFVHSLYHIYNDSKDPQAHLFRGWRPTEQEIV